MECLRILITLIEVLILIVSRGILVLLVLGHEIVHVRLSLSELHLVHTLTSVPVKERLPAEHGRELLTDTAEQLLDSRRVTDERRRHLETLRRDITHGRLHVVRDPLHKVRRVLRLDVEHLLIDLLHGHTTTEHGSAREVTTVARIGSSHHVLGIEHLRRQLRHRQEAVLGGTTRGQRSEPNHEEVKTRERHHVHGKLTQISVELTREAETARDTGHHDRHEMVQITVRGRRQLQGTEADIIQSLVIDAERLIGVLNELVHGQGSVVRLDHGIGHLRRRHNGERAHHTVGVLLTDLRDEESTHTGTRTTTERVRQLEALEAVTGLGLLADDIEDGIHELGTLGVVTLGPVVTGTTLAEHEVIGAEELTEGTSAHGIHRTGLEVDEDGAGHVLATGGLIVVHVDTLELELGVTTVRTSGVYTMLIGNNFPELGYITERHDTNK